MHHWLIVEPEPDRHSDALISSSVAQPTTRCITPYQTLAKEPTLSVAKQAVDAAGLKDLFDDSSLDATIFLPSNDGFTTFLETANADAEDLLAFDGLVDLLKYHVHLVAHNISDFYEGEVIDTVNGDTFSINFVKKGDPKYASCEGYHLHIGSHSITDADPVICNIQACQSVIHILDHPLLPEDDSIPASFSGIKIKSDTGNEEEHDHDHDGQDHNDLDELNSGASPGYMAHSIAIFAWFCVRLVDPHVMACRPTRLMVVYLQERLGIDDKKQSDGINLLPFFDLLID